MTSASQAQPPKKPPQLPVGNSSSLRGFTENFSFHSSPEFFIASRVEQWQKQHPSVLDARIPIRAKILNRNVAVVSSYHHIQAVLNASISEDEPESQSPPYVASKAYHELMTQFFPPPNLLLSDGCPHAQMRRVWDEKMQHFHAPCLERDSSLSKTISSFFSDGLCLPTNTPIDLYATMKKLAWRILLGTFLDLTPDDDEELFQEVQKLHEDLLRGQFSLMPISVNTRFWQSPRSKGISARKKLQELIMRRLLDLQKVGGDVTHFFNLRDEEPMEEVRDHVLMMTSSLAVKGLASLLTAYFLNLFIFERGGVKVVDEMRPMMESGQTEQQRKYLKSVYFETERLSPPIVGVMRRVTTDVVIEGGDGETETLLPAGWDVWMYFVGGGRDSAVFGETCMNFDPMRYMEDGVPEPFGFGAGPKACLGKGFVRDIVLFAAESCLESGMSMEGVISKPGLMAWLGWDVATPEQWAADMKQLPTQHPKAPILVTFVK